jgi:hypothetical protein
MVRIIRNLLRQVGFSDVDDANDGAARSPGCVPSVTDW